ncbi:MAG: DNA ligase [Armatimonadetes bacterium]|nr:DNA ligase [Armatimonadota bacterium]
MSLITAIKSVALFYRAGSSDKEYNASIEPKGDGYVVNFAYGPRGNAIHIGTKTQSPVSLAEAEKIYDMLVRSKTSKGYVPNGDATPFSGVDTAGRVTGLVPMLLNPISEDEAQRYIDDPQWYMQEKLDGKRIMARVENGVVTASNRKGLSVGIPAEVEGGLKAFGDCVVDGELVGAKYILFDMLEQAGRDLRDERYAYRFDLLLETVAMYKPVAVETVASAFGRIFKEALFPTLRHKEGVVFKRADSKYVPGRPASGGSQLKCKFWSSVTAVVMKVNDKRSVALGLFEAGNGETSLVGVGNVTIPANYDVPQYGDLVEIKYLYAYPGGSLYQPQYLGKRDDVPADNVGMLKFKSDDSDEDA